MHIAQVNVGLMQSLGGKAAAPLDQHERDEESRRHQGDERLVRLPVRRSSRNSTTRAMVAGAPIAPPFLGTVDARARGAYGLLGHTWDIYGQMVAVSLRLNGGVPPASQRP